MFTGLWHIFSKLLLATVQCIILTVM